MQTKWKTSLTCYKTCSLLIVPPVWQLAHLAQGWKAAQPNRPACLKTAELENKACFNRLQEASSISLVLAPQSNDSHTSAWQQPSCLLAPPAAELAGGSGAAHHLLHLSVSPPSIRFPEFSIRPKLCLSMDPFLLLRLYPSLRKSHDIHWDLGKMMNLGTGNCR